MQTSVNISTASTSQHDHAGKRGAGGGRRMGSMGAGTAATRAGPGSVRLSGSGIGVGGKDIDLLLCHLRLWMRESFRLAQAFGKATSWLSDEEKKIPRFACNDNSSECDHACVIQHSLPEPRPQVLHCSCHWTCREAVWPGFVQCRTSSLAPPAPASPEPRCVRPPRRPPAPGR